MVLNRGTGTPGPMKALMTLTADGASGRVISIVHAECEKFEESQKTILTILQDE